MRLRTREITPDRPLHAHADSLKRARFYYAYDHNDGPARMSAQALFKMLDVPKSTAYDWLQERREIGEKATRRHKGRVEKQLLRSAPGPGRPRIIPNASLQALLNSDQRARRRRLETQARAQGIEASRRTLQRSLRRLNAGMFRGSTQSPITRPQAQERQEFATIYRWKSIEGFWDGVIFTDEAHMSLDDFPDEWILRVIGQREEPENVIVRPPKTANVVHFAAWINYYTMASELTFYNDEYDDVGPVKPEPKPRRRPATETDAQYQARLTEWEARKPREPIILKPGNSMRASYYVDNILPLYCDAYNALKARSDELRADILPQDRYNWYLQEDNDPSHGTKNPESLPARYKRRRGVEVYKHPANSPDLNPIEAIWNIIKERVKQYLDDLNSIADLKSALQREWGAVRQDMVVDQIIELPYRLSQVAQSPAVRVKSTEW